LSPFALRSLSIVGNRSRMRSARAIPRRQLKKDALAAAKANLAIVEQNRLLMSLQPPSPVTWSLVISLILWSLFLFCGFGVLSEANPTTIIALAFGAISVASAMFLILYLTQPYSARLGSAIDDPTDARDDRQIAPRAGTPPNIFAARRRGHLESNQAGVVALGAMAEILQKIQAAICTIALPRLRPSPSRQEAGVAGRFGKWANSTRSGHSRSTLGMSGKDEKADLY
jgi:hypothetical protein